jgi:hypothetical protein
METKDMQTDHDLSCHQILNAWLDNLAHRGMDFRLGAFLVLASAVHIGSAENKMLMRIGGVGIALPMAIDAPPLRPLVPAMHSLSRAVERSNGLPCVEAKLPKCFIPQHSPS